MNTTPATQGGLPPARQSPVERLEASRARLRLALQAARGQTGGPGDPGSDEDASLIETLRRSGRRVWARHPLRGTWCVLRKAVGPTVLAELKPIVREHPWKLLAVAAGVGAVIAWSRPWRLLRQAALGSALLSFMLPRRAIVQEIMASGLIERLASGELLARAFESASPQPTPPQQAHGPTEARSSAEEPQAEVLARRANGMHDVNEVNGLTDVNIAATVRS